MRIHLRLTMDVGDSPYDDAVTYFIDQYEQVTPERVGGEGNHANAVEQVVLDILTTEFEKYAPALDKWRLLCSQVEIR